MQESFTVGHRLHKAPANGLHYGDGVPCLFGQAGPMRQNNQRRELVGIMSNATRSYPAIGDGISLSLFGFRPSLCIFGYVFRLAHVV